MGRECGVEELTYQADSPIGLDIKQARLPQDCPKAKTPGHHSGGSEGVFGGSFKAPFSSSGSGLIGLSA